MRRRTYLDGMPLTRFYPPYSILAYLRGSCRSFNRSASIYLRRSDSGCAKGCQFDALRVLQNQIETLFRIRLHNP